MARHELTFYQRCNAYVRATEETDLEELSHKVIDATRHAEGCGCNNCIQHAIALQERFHDEAYRIGAWTPEPEEPVINTEFLRRK